MSTGIHCVLQKRNAKTNTWETIDNEFMESQNYNVFCFLAGVRGYEEEHDNIGFQGFPADFEVEKVLDEEATQRNKAYNLEIAGEDSRYRRAEEVYDLKHHGKWMGEHSFGYVDLRTFCEAELPEINLSDRYEVEKHNDGYTVTFTDPYEIDEYYTVRCLQTAFINMYGDYLAPVEINGQVEHFTSVADYRIVYGFDS